MKTKKINYICLVFILFVLKGTEFKAQNLNWVRNVAAASINDVCTDDNNRQYSISYGNYLSNFSFNGNQVAAPNTYPNGVIIKSHPSGNHEWIKFLSPIIAGGYGSCVPNRIIYNAGHIYITGVINGSIDMNPGATVDFINGMNNPFIVKLDTAGNFVWAKSFGGNNTKVYDLEVDAIGNVLMTGSFNTTFSFNGVNQVSNGNIDIFLLKFNSLGQEQWCKTFGSNENYDAGKSIAIDQNNNINVCGYFSGTVDFDPGPSTFSLIGNNQPGTFDGFVSRYDSNGIFITAINIGGSGGNNAARFNGIEVHNNSVYVAGLVYGTVDLNPGALTNNITVSAGILMKFDYQLNLNWHKLIISSANTSEIHQLRIKSNQLYISGIMKGTTDLDPHPTNSFTYTPAATYNAGNTYVVKLDLNGTFVWGAGFLNTPTGGIYINNNIPYGLAITNDGVYIAGEFTGPVDFNPDQNITQITQSQLTNVGIGITTGYLVKLGDCNITNSSIQVNSCNTYTWAQNGQTYNTSGVFQDTLQNVSGCDSIVSLNLTISPNVVGGTTIQTACNSYTWNNQMYTQSGIFTQVLSTINGCDSTATLDLTLNFSPLTPLVTLTNVTDLSTPTQGNATYQWFKCSDNTPIPNATNNTFTATTNGLFGVIVTNGCGSDTSQCINVSTINVNELAYQVTISPNPTSETLEIQMHSKNLENVKYIIFDGASRKVLEGILVLENGSYNVNLQPLVPSAYSIVIEEIGSYKFIKQ